MKTNIYRKFNTYFDKRENEVRAIKTISKTLTAIVYISYPSLLAYLLVANRDLIYKAVLIPAVMLVIVSVARLLINRPRPYERFGFKPLLEKDKKGESMPSRHIFSVFMIAMTFLYVCPPLSVPLFIIGVVMGIIRIIGGVHYPSDIIVGALTGILSGFLFYV